MTFSSTKQNKILTVVVIVPPKGCMQKRYAWRCDRWLVPRVSSSAQKVDHRPGSVNETDSKHCQAPAMQTSAIAFQSRTAGAANNTGDTSLR